MSPPSTDTSTAATTPPPVSTAVPLTTTGVPIGTTDPAAGAVIVDTGAIVSVDLVAAARPDWRDAASTPMSASMFSVSCCMLTSVGTAPSGRLRWYSSSPHAHCTVPVLQTSAPLGARYIAMACVSGASMYVAA